MWEGLDRYLITQEVAGEAILDFKHFKTEVSEFMDETRKALYTKADKEIFDQKLHFLREEKKKLTTDTGERVSQEIFEL